MQDEHASSSSQQQRSSRPAPPPPPTGPPAGGNLSYSAFRAQPASTSRFGYAAPTKSSTAASVATPLVASSYQQRTATNSATVRTTGSFGRLAAPLSSSSSSSLFEPKQRPSSAENTKLRQKPVSSVSSAPKQGADFFSMASLGIDAAAPRSTGSTNAPPLSNSNVFSATAFSATATSSVMSKPAEQLFSMDDSGGEDDWNVDSPGILSPGSVPGDEPNTTSATKSFEEDEFGWVEESAAALTVESTVPPPADAVLPVNVLVALASELTDASVHCAPSAPVAPASPSAAAWGSDIEFDAEATEAEVDQGGWNDAAYEAKSSSIATGISTAPFVHISTPPQPVVEEISAASAPPVPTMFPSAAAAPAVVSSELAAVLSPTSTPAGEFWGDEDDDVLFSDEEQSALPILEASPSSPKQSTLPMLEASSLPDVCPLPLDVAHGSSNDAPSEASNELFGYNEYETTNDVATEATTVEATAEWKDDWHDEQQPPLSLSFDDHENENRVDEHQVSVGASTADDHVAESYGEPVVSTTSSPAEDATAATSYEVSSFAAGVVEEQSTTVGQSEEMDARVTGTEFSLSDKMALEGTIAEPFHSSPSDAHGFATHDVDDAAWQQEQTHAYDRSEQHVDHSASQSEYAQHSYETTTTVDHSSTQRTELDSLEQTEYTQPSSEYFPQQLTTLKTDSYESSPYLYHDQQGDSSDHQYGSHEESAHVTQHHFDQQEQQHRYQQQQLEHHHHHDYHQEQEQQHQQHYYGADVGYSAGEFGLHSSRSDGAQDTSAFVSAPSPHKYENGILLSEEEQAAAGQTQWDHTQHHHEENVAGGEEVALSTGAHQVEEQHAVDSAAAATATASSIAKPEVSFGSSSFGAAELAFGSHSFYEHHHRTPSEAEVGSVASFAEASSAGATFGGSDILSEGTYSDGDYASETRSIHGSSSAGTALITEPPSSSDDGQASNDDNGDDTGTYDRHSDASSAFGGARGGGSGGGGGGHSVAFSSEFDVSSTKSTLFEHEVASTTGFDQGSEEAYHHHHHHYGEEQAMDHHHLGSLRGYENEFHHGAAHVEAREEVACSSEDDQQFNEVATSESGDFHSQFNDHQHHHQEPSSSPAISLGGTRPSTPATYGGASSSQDLPTASDLEFDHAETENLFASSNVSRSDPFGASAAAPQPSAFGGSFLSSTQGAFVDGVARSFGAAAAASASGFESSALGGQGNVQLPEVEPSSPFASDDVADDGDANPFASAGGGGGSHASPFVPASSFEAAPRGPMPHSLALNQPAPVDEELQSAASLFGASPARDVPFASPFHSFAPPPSSSSHLAGYVDEPTPADAGDLFANAPPVAGFGGFQPPPTVAASSSSYGQYGGYSSSPPPQEFGYDARPHPVPSAADAFGGGGASQSHGFGGDASSVFGGSSYSGGYETPATAGVGADSFFGGGGGSSSTGDMFRSSGGRSGEVSSSNTHEYEQQHYQQQDGLYQSEYEQQQQYHQDDTYQSEYDHTGNYGSNEFDHAGGYGSNEYETVGYGTQATEAVEENPIKETGATAPLPSAQAFLGHTATESGVAQEQSFGLAPVAAGDAAVGGSGSVSSNFESHMADYGSSGVEASSGDHRQQSTGGAPPVLSRGVSNASSSHSHFESRSNDNASGFFDRSASTPPMGGFNRPSESSSSGGGAASSSFPPPRPRSNDNAAPPMATMSTEFESHPPQPTEVGQVATEEKSHEFKHEQVEEDLSHQSYDNAFAHPPSYPPQQNGHDGGEFAHHEFAGDGSTDSLFGGGGGGDTGAFGNDVSGFFSSQPPQHHHHDGGAYHVQQPQHQEEHSHHQQYDHQQQQQDQHYDHPQQHYDHQQYEYAPPEQSYGGFDAAAHATHGHAHVHGHAQTTTQQMYSSPRNDYSVGYGSGPSQAAGAAPAAAYGASGQCHNVSASPSHAAFPGAPHGAHGMAHHESSYHTPTFQPRASPPTPSFDPSPLRPAAPPTPSYTDFNHAAASQSSRNYETKASSSAYAAPGAPSTFAAGAGGAAVAGHAAALLTSHKHKDPTMVVPSCLASFGFGGNVVTMFPKQKLRLTGAAFGANRNSPRTPMSMQYDNVPQGELRKGPVGLYRMEQLHPKNTSFAEFDTFPGPLNDNVTEETILQFMESKMNAETGSSSSPFEEDERLLMGVLKVLIKCNGKLRSDANANPNDPASPEVQLVSLLKESDQRRRRNQPSIFPSPKTVQYPSHAEATARNASRVRELLLLGDRKAAVDVAIQAQMWPEAMLIGSFTDKDEYKRVLCAYFTSHYAPGDPCRALYLSFADQQEKSVHEPQKLHHDTSTNDASSSAVLSSWVVHVQMLLANRTADTNKILVELGDRLWKESNAVVAAHVCYLLAGHSVEAPSPSSKIALLGADHRAPEEARFYVSPSAVQRTEIYEWVQRKVNPTMTNMIPFQGYKLIYAMMLADHGKLEPAFKYITSMLAVVRAITSTMKPGSSMYLEGMQNQLVVLDDRLRQHLGQVRADSVAASANGKQAKWGLGSVGLGSALSIMGKIVNRVVEGNDAPHHPFAAGPPSTNGSLFQGAPRSSSNNANATPEYPSGAAAGYSSLASAGGSGAGGFAPGSGRGVVGQQLPAAAAAAASFGMQRSHSAHTMAPPPHQPTPATYAAPPRSRDGTGNGYGVQAPAPAAAPSSGGIYGAAPRSGSGANNGPYPHQPQPPHQQPAPGFPAAPVPSQPAPSQSPSFQKPPSLDLSGDAGKNGFANDTSALAQPKSPRSPRPVGDGPGSDKGSSSPKFKDQSKKGGRSKTPPPSRSSSGWLTGLSTFIAAKMNPDAKVAKLGEHMEAYFDEEKKRWVFPGETQAEEATMPSAPPTGPMPGSVPSSSNGGPPNGGPPGTHSAPGSISGGPADSLAALMAPPPARAHASLMKKDPLSAMMAPPSRPQYGQRSSTMPAKRPPPRPQFAVFKPAPGSTSSTTTDQGPPSSSGDPPPPSQ